MTPEQLNKLLESTRDQKFRKKEQWKLDVANANVGRTGTSNWKETIKNRDYSYFTSEENRSNKRKLKAEQLNNPIWKEKFDLKMQEVYKSDKWKDSVIKANKSIERNKKISQAHSRTVITPNGEFTNLRSAASHYKITSEGIRHRIKTQPDKWYYKDTGPSISDRYRIQTSFGKFLSIAECYRYARKQKLFGAELLLDGAKWFAKVLKKYPNDFKKLK